MPDNAAARESSPWPCTRPPAGWYCTRPADHDGPCAARPLYNPETTIDALARVTGKLDAMSNRLLQVQRRSYMHVLYMHGLITGGIIVYVLGNGHGGAGATIGIIVTAIIVLAIIVGTALTPSPPKQDSTPDHDGPGKEGA